jgi:hypothetical protein
MKMFNSKRISILVTILLMLWSVQTMAGDTGIKELKEENARLRAELAGFKAAEAKVKANLALMRGADESMNARDWDRFREVHAADVHVTSPDSPEPQTNMDIHLNVVKAFTDAFPDHQIHLPYKAVFGSGDYICAVHENGGTFTEPWYLPGGQVLQPTGKKYTMTMVTVGKAKDGELIEEMIIYDMSSMARQLGLSGE